MRANSNAGMKRCVSLAFAALMVAGGGVLYGNFSQRWGPPPDLLAAAASLASFPRQIGKWQLADESPLDQDTIEMLECAGFVNRQYINTETSQALSVAIIVGPPGPISVHTPEICYSSRAFEKQSDRISVNVPASSRSDTYWRVDFRTRNVLAEGLRVYYAWSLGPTWKASNSPRFEYGAAPFLYKIQIATPIGPRVADEGTDPGMQFLEELNRTGWNLTIAG